MKSKDYTALLNYIDVRSNELKNVCIYRVHSSYDPKEHKIRKITLKVNYTKDSKPLPEVINGKLPKNVVERSVQFRGDDCNFQNIVDWIDAFINEKKG